MSESSTSLPIPHVDDPALRRHLEEVGRAFERLSEKVYGDWFAVTAGVNVERGMIVHVQDSEILPADKSMEYRLSSGVVTEVRRNKARVAFSGVHDVRVDGDAIDSTSEWIIYVGHAGVGNLSHPVPTSPGGSTENEISLPFARPIRRVGSFTFSAVILNDAPSLELF